MKIIGIFFFCLFSSNALLAQGNKFIITGSIEYEKSVNTFAVNRQQIAEYPPQTQAIYLPMLDQYQRRMPQFARFSSRLVFNTDKTLFTPIEANNASSTSYGLANPSCNQINTIYTNLETNTRVVQKQVFESQFILNDSLSKIKWRLTDETQDIAGYICRRANGLIQDSVYVVAFFTDKIWVSGGPESFSGLPGMILEVSLPHEHITWKAIKIIEGLPSSIIEPPSKGKPIAKKQLIDILNTNKQRKGAMGIYEMKMLLL
jgi:GLPGLI family protein